MRSVPASTPHVRMRLLIAAVLLLSPLAAVSPYAGGTASAAAGVATGWSAAPVQSPPGGLPPTASMSTGNMTCTTPAACVVAGYLWTSTYSFKLKQTQYHYAPLLWNWNGAKWKYATAPGKGSRALVGTGCTSANDCWAVGGSFGAGGTSGYMTHWNGRTWTQWTLADAGGVALNGITCLTSSTCFAVGNRQTSASSAHAVVAAWNGRMWTFGNVPAPKGASWSVLQSIECLSATDCFAMGDAQNSPQASGYFFGEHYNGHAWSLVTVGSVGKFNMGNATGLYGVACISTKHCLAVGSALGYTGGQMGADFARGVAESWDGKHWTPVAVKMTDTLNGIACVRQSCYVALAQDAPMDPLTPHMALASWSGGSLSVLQLDPHGPLDAIGCLPSGWCMVFGQGPGPKPTSPGVLTAEMKAAPPTTHLPVLHN